MTTNELRRGNLVLWNPQSNHPESTLPLVQVVITSILEDQLGYVAPNIDNRVEPFEDDLIEKEAPHKPLSEFTPLPLTAELLKKYGYQTNDISGDAAIYIKEPLQVELKTDKASVVRLNNFELQYAYFHQLQNLHYALTGEELEIS